MMLFMSLSTNKDCETCDYCRVQNNSEDYYYFCAKCKEKINYVNEDEKPCKLLKGFNYKAIYHLHKTS